MTCKVCGKEIEANASVKNQRHFKSVQPCIRGDYHWGCYMSQLKKDKPNRVIRSLNQCVNLFDLGNSVFESGHALDACFNYVLDITCAFDTDQTFEEYVG